MLPASDELTLEKACARLGLDPHAPDLLDSVQTGLQSAFQRAVQAAREGQPHIAPERYSELLAAYRFLRALAPAESPEMRTFEVWPTQIFLTPREAVTGGWKTGRLPTGRPFTTRLPPGVRDGDLVWALGWLIQARIENGPDMQVKGDDLWLTARKPASALRPGHRITIDTPTGQRSFRLTGEAVEKRLAQVPGAGLPAARRRPAGDLYVRLEPGAEPRGRLRPARVFIRRFVPLHAA